MLIPIDTDMACCCREIQAPLYFNCEVLQIDVPCVCPLCLYLSGRLCVEASDSAEGFLFLHRRATSKLPSLGYVVLPTTTTTTQREQSQCDNVADIVPTREQTEILVLNKNGSDSPRK